MSKQHQQLETDPIPKSWEWIPCNYDVRRVSKESQTTWNLSPSITLKLPSEQGPQEPIVNLKIEQSRPFMYQEEVGWNWHKSWNLPDIGIELEITDPTTQERLAPPNKIYCKIQVVIPTVSQMQTFHLLDVGVRGNQKIDLENGRCIFTGLKFNTTSYNHDHQKFHLVITLYLCQQKFEFPQILESRISPPVFVDSRKSARDITQQKKQKIQSYFDLFPPDKLEKQYVLIKATSEEEISNSLDGLVKYFSAPNIRHKIKHPYFLAIKFNQCITLYVNSNMIPSQNIESVVQNTQLMLFKCATQPSNLKDVKIEQKSLIIGVDSSNSLNQCSNKQKKILDFLEPFINDQVDVLIDPVGLTKPFIKVDSQELRNSYIECFPFMQNYKITVLPTQQTPDKKKEKQAKQEAKDEEPQLKKILRTEIIIQGPSIIRQPTTQTHNQPSSEPAMKVETQQDNVLPQMQFNILNNQLQLPFNQMQQLLLMPFQGINSKQF